MEKKVFRLIFLSVTLLTLCIFSIQILLTRLFSVTLWYHYAFFVIALTVFGLALGSFVSFSFKNKINKKTLYLAYFLMTLSFIPLLFLVPKLNFSFSFSLKSYLSIFYVFFLSQLPFFFTGFILATFYRYFKNSSGKLYFFDFFGASIGIVLSVFLINTFSLINTLIIISLFSSLSFLFFSFLFKKKAILLPIIILLFFSSLFVFNLNSNFLNVYEKKPCEKELFSKWNSFSKVRVCENETVSGYGFAMSNFFKGSFPESLHVDIDSFAFTPIIKFNESFKEVEFLKYDITSFTYYLKNGSVLVIGSGGGRDVLTALLFKNEKVKGVELNPIIVDLVKNKFANYSGNIYDKENVEIIIDDGRNYIRNSDEKFDIIQFSIVDTFAATSAGALSLSENNLYTVEAVSEYIQHLSDNGLLTISWWEGEMSLKSTLLYKLAAENLNLEAEKHILIIKNKDIINHIFKKSEFNQEELKKISDLAEKLDFEIIYPSDSENDNKKIITSNLNFVKKADIKPPTDDSPFFFNWIRVKGFKQLLDGISSNTSFFFVYALFVIILIMSLILLLFSFYITRKIHEFNRGKFLNLLYFVFLGMGFVIIENIMLQKFILFLGHPTYSITITLFSLLFFAGIGGLISNKFLNPGKKIRKILLILIFIILTYTFFLYPFMISLNSFSIKIIFSVLFLGILGIFLGMPFPLAIKMTEKELIPAAYSLNAAFFVLGSVIAIIIAINFSFSIALYSAAFLYFLAFLISRTFK